MDPSSPHNMRNSEICKTYTDNLPNRCLLYNDYFSIMKWIRWIKKVRLILFWNESDDPIRETSRSKTYWSWDWMTLAIDFIQGRALLHQKCRSAQHKNNERTCLRKIMVKTIINSHCNPVCSIRWRKLLRLFPKIYREWKPTISPVGQATTELIKWILNN